MTRKSAASRTRTSTGIELGEQSHSAQRGRHARTELEQRTVDQDMRRTLLLLALGAGGEIALRRALNALQGVPAPTQAQRQPRPEATETIDPREARLEAALSPALTIAANHVRALYDSRVELGLDGSRSNDRIVQRSEDERGVYYWAYAGQDVPSAVVDASFDHDGDPLSVSIRTYEPTERGELGRQIGIAAPGGRIGNTGPLSQGWYGQYGESPGEGLGGGTDTVSSPGDDTLTEIRTRIVDGLNFTLDLFNDPNSTR